MSRKITLTILSMSLLTVMAGAAVAPALGIISQHFSGESPLLIKFIVSMPALFIILVNLLFAPLCKIMRTRTIALIGLFMYVVCGAGCFFVDDITSLLVLRALLGVSVGLVMPLSTGLLAYYNKPEEMPRLMGLSAAMNQLGGVVATLLAGVLASIQWNYAFLVYLLGIIAVVLVLLYLPSEKLIQDSKKLDARKLLKFHPSVVGMWLIMLCFFVFVTNFAITEKTIFSTLATTIIMVSADVVAFFIGMLFGRIMGIFPKQMKYMPPVLFAVGFTLFAWPNLLPSELVAVLIGGAFVGIANGLGIPYLNTIASIKGGKMAVASVMPLLSAALYLGQFTSPIIITATSQSLFGDDLRGPYKVGIIIAAIYMVQVITTRHFQSLPPTPKNEE